MDRPGSARVVGRAAAAAHPRRPAALQQRLRRPGVVRHLEFRVRTERRTGGYRSMPQSDATYGAMRARWPLIILVVGSVAAASLALGLLVVGPMIQRRMETPPPVLATSGTTALPPSQRAVTPADVQIKERIVRR